MFITKSILYNNYYTLFNNSSQAYRQEVINTKSVEGGLNDDLHALFASLAGDATAAAGPSAPLASSPPSTSVVSSTPKRGEMELPEQDDRILSHEKLVLKTGKMCFLQNSSKFKN